MTHSLGPGGLEGVPCDPHAVLLSPFLTAAGTTCAGPSFAHRGLTMTLIASRSFIAQYPSGTSSSRTTRSKTRPGSIRPSRMSGVDRQLRCRHRLVLGNTDAADRPAWTGDLDGGLRRPLGADAFEDRVNTETNEWTARTACLLPPYTILRALACSAGSAQLSGRSAPIVTGQEAGGVTSQRSTRRSTKPATRAPPIQ